MLIMKININNKENENINQNGTNTTPSMKVNPEIQAAYMRNKMKYFDKVLSGNMIWLTNQIRVVNPS